MISAIKIVTEEEANTVDFVVCMRVGAWSPFNDNVTGVCAHCGHAVFFRPYMPTKPPKICVECAVDLVDAKGKPLQ